MEIVGIAVATFVLGIALCWIVNKMRKPKPVVLPPLAGVLQMIPADGTMLVGVQFAMSPEQLMGAEKVLFHVAIPQKE